MSLKSFGFVFLFVGVCLIVMGYFPKTHLFSWFGRLPGDIVIDRPGFKFYAPIASMLVLSLLFSFLMFIFRKLSSLL
ncbi:MAG: DUF2905 domain-containing protein [Bdellovibrionales bacterium]|nr:DUF2905 domain-containing protein [Bdellovibrionales bacterium]